MDGGILMHYKLLTLKNYKMKNIFYFILSVTISFTSFSQDLSVFNLPDNGSFGESVFLDASSFETALTNQGKGFTFPRTDLTLFNFVTLVGDGFSTFISGYDGTIVYNTVSGSTPATNSGIGNQVVVPGFYYFSNPGSTGDSATGEWLPLGGAATTVKSAVITGVPADGLISQLNLSSGAVASGGPLVASTVTRFLEAKIYDSTGQLVLTASSNYDSATNILTTGNGGINTLLSTEAGPYTVLLAFQ
jgi:hypothetical protein